jgi:cob(I)alamin adenosyltransferase
MDKSRSKTMKAIENANTRIEAIKVEYQIAKKDANLYYNRELNYNCDKYSLKEENFEIYWNKCYEDNRKALKEARTRVKKAEKNFKSLIDDIKSAERKLVVLNWLSFE